MRLLRNKSDFDKLVLEGENKCPEFFKGREPIEYPCMAKITGSCTVEGYGNGYSYISIIYRKDVAPLFEKELAAWKNR